MNSFDVVVGNSVRDFSDRVALCDERVSLTYAQLADRVNSFARHLLSWNVCPGDAVVAVIPNSCASIEVLLACLKVGAVFGSCNTRFSEEVIFDLLSDSEPKVVVASEYLFERMHEQGCFDGGNPPFVCVCVDGESHGGFVGYDDLVSRTAGDIEVSPVGADDAALVLYTSGTTMKPKDAVLSHGALASRISIDTKSMGITGDEVFLCVLPLFHTTCITPLVVLANGGRVVVLSRHDPQTLARSIIKYDVSFLGMVPSLLKQFVDYLAQSPQAFPSLRMVLYGGSPMTSEFVRKAQSVLSCGFLRAYGMTEVASSITLLYPQDHEDSALLKTVGRVVEGMQIRIVDDTLCECPAGSPGEIAVKTPTVMTGYRHHPEKTSQVLRDGWYLTGDIGFIDEKGYVTLLDRKDNMIITGGENVFPLQVANCIRLMDSRIVDVCVVGVPDARWGEAVAAAIVVEEGCGLSEDAVKEYCKNRLGSFMKPQKVVITNHPFKRSATGKVDRNSVKALFAEG